MGEGSHCDLKKKKKLQLHEWLTQKSGGTTDVTVYFVLHVPIKTFLLSHIILNFNTDFFLNNINDWTANN